MSSSFTPILNNKDPMITLRIPSETLRNLVLRAEENGHSIELEMAIRLVRSLERDVQMVMQDNEDAYLAFRVMEKLQSGLR